MLYMHAGTEIFTDYFIDVVPVDSGLNSMNCTGEESMLTECKGLYENSTADGCSGRATVLCHEESKYVYKLCRLYNNYRYSY